MIDNIYQKYRSKFRLVFKYISKFSIFIWIALFFLFSKCDKEIKEYPNPSIHFISEVDFISGDTSVLLGDTLLIGILAESNSDVALTHFNISFEMDDEIVSIDTGIYESTFEYHRKIVKGIADIEKWNFYVRDRNSRKSETISINISKDSLSQYGNIISIPSVIFGAQNNALYGNFFSLEDEVIYFLEVAFENQNKINLLYFYDLIEADENTIASPGANIDESVFPGIYGLQNWSVKNTTRFKLAENLTFQDFNACINDSLILANTFEFSTGNRKSKNLTADDIIAFATENGIKGLFKVNDVIGAEEGYIELAIKMQEL